MVTVALCDHAPDVVLIAGCACAATDPASRIQDSQ